MTPPLSERYEHEVPLRALLGRVVSTHRRVEFNDCDAYGHMTAAAFLRFAVDHRFSGTHDQMGIASFDLPETTGLGWPIRRVQIDYLGEAAFGDRLLIQSWVDELRRSRLLIRLEIRIDPDLELCARLALSLIAFDLKERRAVPLPTGLPLHRPVDLGKLAWAEGYPRLESKA